MADEELSPEMIEACRQAMWKLYRDLKKDSPVYWNSPGGEFTSIEVGRGRKPITQEVFDELKRRGLVDLYGPEPDETRTGKFRWAYPICLSPSGMASLQRMVRNYARQKAREEQGR